MAARICTCCMAALSSSRKPLGSSPLPSRSSTERTDRAASRIARLQRGRGGGQVMEGKENVEGITCELRYNLRGKQAGKHRPTDNSCALPIP